MGTGAIKVENLERTELPQHFADRFGWEELVQTVSDVYHELPQTEREQCAILAENYGQAGAIDLLGKKYGLPKSISGHLSFYVWGSRAYTGEFMIIVGYHPAAEAYLKRMFEDVQIKAIVYNEYAMLHENNNPVFLCRKLKVPMEELWHWVKNMS